MEPEKAENDWIIFSRKYKFSKESGLGQLDDGTLIAVDPKSREVKFSTIEANHSSLLPAFVSTPEHILHKGFDMNLDKFIRQHCTPPTFIYVLSYDAQGNPSKTYTTTKLEVREAIQDMFRILMYAHQEKAVCFNGFSTENLVFVDGKLNMWKLKRFELSESGGREKDMKSAYNILLKIFGTKGKAPKEITSLFDVVEKYSKEQNWQDLELLMATHLGVLNTRDRITYFKELQDQKVKHKGDLVQSLVSRKVQGTRLWENMFNREKKDEFKATEAMVDCFEFRKSIKDPKTNEIKFVKFVEYGKDNNDDYTKNTDLIRCMRNFSVHLKDHVSTELKADNEYLEMSLMYLFGIYGIQFQSALTDLQCWKLLYQSIYEKVESNEERQQRASPVVSKPLPRSEIKEGQSWAKALTGDQATSSSLSDNTGWAPVTGKKKKGKK